VQVEGERSRILRSGDWTERNKDKEVKGKRSIGLANTEVYQGCSEVLGIGKLLLLIHSRLCNHSQTITQYDEEGLEVGINRKTGRSIQRVKGEVHKGTGVSSAGSR